MSIDWTSQSVAAFSSLIIGAIWYGWIFNKQWQAASGVSEEQIKNGPSPIILYGVSLVLAFIITIGLYGQIVGLHNYIAQLKGETFTNSFGHGAYHGFIDSLIFGAIPVLVTNSMYDQRNWQYIFINIGYWMITFTVMGGILGAFG